MPLIEHKELAEAAEKHGLNTAYALHTPHGTVGFVEGVGQASAEQWDWIKKEGLIDEGKFRLVGKTQAEERETLAQDGPYDMEKTRENPPGDQKPALDPHAPKAKSAQQGGRRG